MSAPSADAAARGSGHRPWLAGAILAFVALRLIAWSSTVRFEDHDSLGYMVVIRAFRSLDPASIGALSPDSIPLYPIVAAVLSIVTGDLETAARLASMLGGAMILLAAVAIAWRLGGAEAAMLCALLVAVNPLLTWLSIAVLAEALYVGIVYAGLWLFWSWRGQPRVATGAALGAVFALAFLTRFEGVLYLAVIPFLQGAHFLLTRDRGYRARDLARWGAAFALAFVVVSAPQIWDVSRKMNAFAINGRQSWSVLMASGTGQAAIYGLDYSDSRINLFVVHEDPTLRRQLGTALRPIVYARMAYGNWDDIYREHVGRAAGPLLLIFFGFGLVVLLSTGRRLDALVAVTVLGTGIAGPLFQPYLLLRHMVVLVPMICIVASVGLVWAGGQIAAAFGGRVPAPWIARALAVVSLLLMVYPVREVLSNPPSGYRYDPAAMHRAVEAVRSAAAADGGEVPVLAARMAYVPFYTEARWIRMPYTDYDGLVRYLRLNDTRYVLVEHGHMSDRPFLPAFTREQPPPDFRLLFRDVDADGRRIELYRFLPSAMHDTAAREVPP